MDAALATALRATFTGSTMPALARSVNWPVDASRPSPNGSSRTFATMTLPSWPAFSAIQRSGSPSALRTIATPVASSPWRPRLPSRTLASCTSAAPPPGITPSSTAALVAEMASSMRCLRSRSSISVAAPTLMTATPPDSLASRSLSFSLSQSESDASISLRICSIRSAISDSLPAPPTIVVLSLVTTIRRARPSCSRVTESSLYPSSGAIIKAAL